jgi:hypothetical protein
MEPRKPEPSIDPATERFVAASIEEIRLAEELRRKIEQRYLGHPVDVSASPRIVGAA